MSWAQLVKAYFKALNDTDTEPHLITNFCLISISGNKRPNLEKYFLYRTAYIRVAIMGGPLIPHPRESKLLADLHSNYLSQLPNSRIDPHLPHENDDNQYLFNGHLYEITSKHAIWEKGDIALLIREEAEKNRERSKL